VKLSSKLIIFSSILIFLTLVIGTLSIVQMSQINFNTQELSKNWLPTIKTAGELSGLVNEYRRNELVHILVTEESLMREYESKLRDLASTIDIKIKEYEPMMTEPEERLNFPKFQASWNSYLASHKQIEDLSRQHKIDSAVKLILGDARLQYNDALKYLSNIIEVNNKGGQLSANDAETSYNSGKTLTVCLLIISVVLASIISAYLINTIRKQLGEDPGYLKFVATEIANGNLNVSFKPAKNSECVYSIFIRMVTELKNKIEFTEGILKGITFPCVVVDPDGKIQFANQAVIDFFDREGSPKDHIGVSLGKFVYNDPTQTTITQKAFLEKRYIKIEKTTFQTIKGTAKIANVESSPVYDFDHNVVAGLTIFTDITELVNSQIKAEQAKVEGMLHAAQRLESVVEIITSASEELSAQIEQSSRGSEEQAHRIGETATSMEQMNATVLEVAKSASSAASTADQAKVKAEEGAKIVQRVNDFIKEIGLNAHHSISDMDNLGNQAEEIGQILNVISDIADQTNLLALNAAIEAARAGEAGRGFAVVADEVRKLAEKTMTATKEVGEAIRGIQSGTKKNIDNVERAGKAIEEVTKLANTSGESLHQIVSLAEATTDQVRSIATASEEQSSASEEINRSIEDVNRVSSETADAMRQSALAVGELANQAQVLKRLIDEMKSDSDSSLPSLPHSKKPLALGRA